MTTTLPILYSFRRCPYAMRARFALKYAGVSCVLREVNLRDKPESLLRSSHKGTVPVLVFPHGEVIEESIKIVEWALEQKGEPQLSPSLEAEAQALIQFNDTEFVKIAHRYKYRDKYPEADFHPNEQKLYQHLATLNHRLSSRSFLIADNITKADIAVFPFIRQVVQIAPEKFAMSSLQQLMQWLNNFLQLPLFEYIMFNHAVWVPGDSDVIF